MTVSDQLAAAALEAPDLPQILLSITKRGVSGDFPALNVTEGIAATDWSRALLLASALVETDVEVAQDAALRLAQGALLDPDSEPGHRRAAAVLLDRLGNVPAVELAVSRHQLSRDAWLSTPAPLKMDVVRRRLELAIPLEDGGTLAANPFQRRFWTAAERHRWVSVSAPTSAGKSYIVGRWFERQMATSVRFRGAYLVPTRALVEEAGANLRALLPKQVVVLTMPWDAAMDQSPLELYVFTQERMHLLLRSGEAPLIDVLFIDEAQKVGDDQRGLLLQQVIEETTQRNPRGQVVFASPLSANPELLLDGGPPSQLSLRAETVTVSQNLLWVDQERGSKWTLDVVVDGVPHAVGAFETDGAPGQSTSKRLSMTAIALSGAEPGNLVYVNIAADAEKIAIQLAGALSDQIDFANNRQVRDLQDLVRRTIHPQYALIDCLRSGVAFHYGNMPLLVRSEIERLFRVGILRYLVCTSTLLEGVNLPCRVLYVRNPRKGRNTPMSAGDFWNLAGRAGRWGKEFSGNIVCVDARRKDVWDTVPRRRERQPIRRAYDSALTDAERVADFIAQGAPLDGSAASPELERLSSYLASKTIKGEHFPPVSGIGAADLATLEAAFALAISSIDVPPEIVLRHPGISPWSMQRLLDYLRSAADPRALILPPLDSEDPVAGYQDALLACGSTMGADFGGRGRSFMLALLLVNWMSGQPLARIIRARIGWLERNGREYSLAAEIRGVMADLEQEARFRGPKYLGCYADILRSFLRDAGLAQEAEAMDDVEMLLELGISRTTEISLMSLGLSRTSALMIADFILDDALDREACREWLESQSLLSLGIPQLVVREVDLVRRPVFALLDEATATVAREEIQDIEAPSATWSVWDDFEPHYLGEVLEGHYEQPDYWIVRYVASPESDVVLLSEPDLNWSEDVGAERVAAYISAHAISGRPTVGQLEAVAAVLQAQARRSGDIFVTRSQIVEAIDEAD